MATKITVRGVIYDKTKNLLLCQQLKHFKKDAWYLPGGKVDAGENLEKALERELLEECGVQAVIGRLVYVNQFFDGTDDVIAFIFNVENVKDFSNIDLATTSHGYQEVAEVAFISQTENIFPESIRQLDLLRYTTSVMPTFIDDENLAK